MYDSTINPAATTLDTATATPLFMWHGFGIVLIGEREGDRWILARGWSRGDRLEAIRRWSFAQPMLFAAQVRRLVREAGANDSHARDEGLRSLAWTEALLQAQG
ncbi:MAG: hypothetical protein IT338_05460 [Thermomicrobiales bacterium]|nr:hypothetical protein [Thermomicrobiales bacterium]